MRRNWAVVWRECPERRKEVAPLYFKPDYLLMRPFDTNEPPVEGLRVVDVWLHDKFLRVKCMTPAGSEHDFDFTAEEATGRKLRVLV